jgi:hypothetical protein
MFVTRFKPNCIIVALAGTWSTLLVNAEAASENGLLGFSAATNATARQIVNDDMMGGLCMSSFRPIRETVDGSLAE